MGVLSGPSAGVGSGIGVVVAAVGGMGVLFWPSARAGMGVLFWLSAGVGVGIGVGVAAVVGMGVLSGSSSSSLSDDDTDEDGLVAATNPLFSEKLELDEMPMGWLEATVYSMDRLPPDMAPPPPLTDDVTSSVEAVCAETRSRIVRPITVTTLTDTIHTTIRNRRKVKDISIPLT